MDDLKSLRMQPKNSEQALIRIAVELEKIRVILEKK